MRKIIPIIVAGGVGSRLWPVSTPDVPKQFIPLREGGTCFGNAVARVANEAIFDRPLVVCSESHSLLVKHLARDASPYIICEPVGRNTAPAFSVGVQVAQSLQSGDDAIVLILPADHYIPDIAAFEEAVLRAIPMAEDGHIVTFGIKPEFAHTQYGYIETGDLVSGGYRVASFTEKPDVDTAQDYLDSGRYLWNSGIFMARLDILITEIKSFQPDIYLYTKQAWELSRMADGVHILDKDVFSRVPKISFDYAVMEHTAKASVIAVDFKWRDMGGWDALLEFVVSEDIEKAIHSSR